MYVTYITYDIYLYMAYYISVTYYIYIYILQYYLGIDIYGPFLGPALPIQA